MMSSMMGTASFNGVLPLIDIILIARFIMDALQLNLSFMAFIVLFISDSMGMFLFSISFCKERESGLPYDMATLCLLYDINGLEKSIIPYSGLPFH